MADSEEECEEIVQEGKWDEEERKVFSAFGIDPMSVEFVDVIWE